MFIQTGTGIKRRILDIQSISLELGIDCCDALPALHAFTGNDYTSAFHGIGKVRAYKAMLKSENFISAFKRIGNSFIFDTKDFAVIEEFVCSLYGAKQCKDVNEARYAKFCSTVRATEPQKLPPTRDALLCHCKRVSYVTAVVKKSLNNHPNIPNPYEGYGWVLREGKLEIQWMLLPPAPDQVMQLITCGCKTGCSTRACSCKSNGLSCTDLCKCKDCVNSTNYDTDDSTDDDSNAGDSCDETDSESDNSVGTDDIPIESDNNDLTLILCKVTL